MGKKIENVFFYHPPILLGLNPSDAPESDRHVQMQYEDNWATQLLLRRASRQQAAKFCFVTIWISDCNLKSTPTF